jgi:predicted Zn-dependent protease
MSLVAQMSGKSDFISTTRRGFSSVSSALFRALKAHESLSLSLWAEETDFIRLNKARVRQTIHVRQVELEMRIQSEGKTLKMRWNLALKDPEDITLSLLNLGRARQLLTGLPLDPFQTDIKNHGQSSCDVFGDFPSSQDILRKVAKSAEGSDFAGLVCAGLVVSATQNSLGQSHWFSSNSFYIDYSLHSEAKSVKGCYAGSLWSDSEWTEKLADSKKQLSLMAKPGKILSPGRYRLYLAPAAVSEILNHFEWGALSQRAIRQGTSPLLKLARNEVNLSPLLKMRENFELNLCPKFNSFGEISANKFDLISEGKLHSLLTNEKSAKEFSLPSNGANQMEALRSPEISPGTLARTEILSKLETGLYISNLHYLAWSDHLTARLTGMTRYGCFWVENGHIVGPIQDMRFDESLYDLWGESLLALTDFQEIIPSVGSYFRRALGGHKIPGMLIDSARFTL